MPPEDSHPSDQELLLASDGELSHRRAARIQAHLAACWVCRTRQREIEGTIADFIHSHHQNVNPGLPPDGARALLKARLSELAGMSRHRSWLRPFQFPFATNHPAWVRAALLLVTLGTALMTYRLMDLRESLAYRFGVGSTPRASLTPGARIIFSRDKVCVADHTGPVGVVPAALRQKVFRIYGIPNANPNAYEVDYLITPELGGADDIHNLWPEPYSATIWNAHVKDALENRLHQMVCAGTLDLATAQHDISTNWIAAYKKYFHTDRPVS